MVTTGVPPVRALAWDPTGTATLALCPLPSHGHGQGQGRGVEQRSRGDDDDDDDDRGNNNSINLDIFLSHDGTGCSPEETECLLTCLDARDAWLAAREQQQRHQQHRRTAGISISSSSRGYSSSSTSTATVAELSMNYRAAMCKCLMQLQEKAAQRAAAASSTNADNGENDGAARDKTNPIEDANNMELLTLSYSISHLVEIFLLPSLADSASSTTAATTERRLENGSAGSLTADTVRYLRLHHSRGGSYMELPQVQIMLDCDQPEYYRFPAISPASSNNPTNENDSIIIPGPFEFPFWNLLLQFVIEGELYKAWNLLSHHSACRQAAEDEEAAASSEGRGFEILQRILLSAPLPGGRGDNYCDDSGLDDYLEEEMLEREEEEEANLSSLGRRGGRRQQHHEVDAEEDDLLDDDIHVDYMDGVSSNAYLLWETLPRRADKIRRMRYRHNFRLRGRRKDDDFEAARDTLSGSPTVPELYQPRVALNAFRVWQETIREIAFPAGIGNTSSNIGELASLFRRFPPLQQIISILVGVVPPSIVKASTLSWSERLVMELLYSRPDILPEDIAVRAKVAMGATAAAAASQTSTLTKIILRIMQGSAGEVIQTLFSVCGGSSGAALPAAMVRELFVHIL